MTPKEKHRTELDSMILKRKQMIMGQAMVEFSQNGIESTSMADVAKASEVGIASLYRYFSSKTDLVIQSAVVFWQKAEEYYIPSFLTRQFNAMSGIRQIETIARLVIKSFHEYREFLIFLNDFETFLRKHKISRAQLTDYESEILKIKPYITRALEKGLEDHTIRLHYSVEETYFTLSRLLVSFAQKLAVYNQILGGEEIPDTTKMMETTVSMIIDWLRAEPAQNTGDPV